MRVRIRNALVVTVIALGVFVLAEELGLTGTDLTGQVFRALVWQS